MPNLSTMVAPKALRRDAAGWTHFCREFVVTKRRLCKQVVAILEAHPDRPQPLPPSIQISKTQTSETLVRLESMDFAEADMDIPKVPQDSPTSSCCSPKKSPREADSKPPPEEPRPPSKIGAFLKKEYTKICLNLKYKFEKMFPKQADLINSMLWDIKELEFNLNLLEMQCDKLQKYFETPDISAAILKRRTCALAQSFCEIRLHYEKAIDCKSEFHKKMKKYVHDKLAEYAAESEHQRSESPVAGCSGEQNRPSAKSPKENVMSTTPQRRSNRLAQASVNALEDPQEPSSSKSSSADFGGEHNSPSAKKLQENVSTTPQRRANPSAHASGSAPMDSREPTSSKRTPKHSAKEDTREKKKLKMPETEPQSSSPGRMVQVITRENRDEVNFELSGDSADETSRDTISTSVYESVEGMVLKGSEDDVKKKARHESARKAGSSKSKKASPKKALAETADVAKTRSPFKSKPDPKKTGTKQKKFYTKRTPTKSKYGYTRVPLTDSDEN